MSRIIGQLIEGFSVKLIAAGVALYVASYAGIAITDLFARVNSAMGGL